MTAPATAIVTNAHPEHRALVTLGEDRVVVSFAGGSMHRWKQTVRLYYGTHLYSAGPFRYGDGGPVPHDDAKVVPFEPGYSALVAGMGGRILIPPVIRDEDGRAQPNPTPLAETAIGAAYRWTCLAVCVLRHPIDGSLVVSTGRATVDARATLVQSFLSGRSKKGEGNPFDREDVLRIVADDQVEEARGGECKGWAAYPTGAEVTLLVNPKHPAVREKIADHVNLMKTIAQQAQTKAGRIAADRNPLFRGRCVWRWDQLREEWIGEGENRRRTGRRYVDVVVYGWAQKADAMDSLAVQRILEEAAAKAADMDSVIEVDADATIDGDPDTHLDPETIPPSRLLEERPEAIPEPTPKEKVPVSRTAEPAAAADQAAPPPPSDLEARIKRLVETAERAERELAPEAVKAAREKARIFAPLHTLTEPQLRTYIRTLAEV